MFLYYWAAGWTHRAAWRCGIHTDSTAPSFLTALRVYGLTGKR